MVQQQRTGMMTVEELRGAVAQGTIDTVIAGFTDPYGRLKGKRFDASFFLDHVSVHGTHACDYLFTVDMEMEPVEGYAFASWQQGYGDVHVEPDLATLRRAAWTDDSALVLCNVSAQNDGGDHRGHGALVSPRDILNRQVQRLADAGLAVQAASELECYLYTDSFRDVARGAPPTPTGWYSEDYDLLQGHRHEPVIGRSRRCLQASGVPVENSKGETGIGQHEVNLAHCEPLEAADRHAVLKFAMKQIADDLGASVTFMAKPVSDDAGSSCHLHLSLWRDGANAFSTGSGIERDGHSDLFRWFLGGWMHHVGDVMAWYAPTVNSYKRYVDGSWAPTRLVWDIDNRTAGFRIVGNGDSLRIECRIPGADCNPYLAHAAALASGLAGIERRIEPPARRVGDAYGATEAAGIPRSLGAAADAFERSEMARDAFGDAVVDHYTHMYRTEVDAFDQAVTDWERVRYFERI